MNWDNEPFGREIDEFLRHKRSLGFKYGREEQLLKMFSQLCGRNGWDGPDLTKDMVDAWCEKLPFEAERGGGQHCARVSLIRQFAIYLQSTGHCVWFPMNVAHEMSRHSRFVAYVFTHVEMERLIAAADDICPHPASTMHLVMPTLLRLLYSSGTRISETLSIQMRDVDLEAGVIRMVNTKNDKERLVPMSVSMADVLRTYCSILHPNPQPDDHLFCNVCGQRYNNQSAYTGFRKLLIKAGIPHGGRGAGPRIHDVRHTAACHILQRADERGVDLTAMLPVLAEYLGHASVAATGRYLQMTAEVYPTVNTLVERVCAGMIPEVAGDD